MFHTKSQRGVSPRSVSCALTVAGVTLGSVLLSTAASAQVLTPGNLVVSRSVYSRNSSVRTGDILPPGCTGTTDGCPSGSAVAGSVYPTVFNNDTYDASFGITSPIYLDQVTVKGDLLNTIEVPNNLTNGGGAMEDSMVTSFSSKSELGLHLSTDGTKLSFMGYVAPVASVDASNANTALAPDPTNPDGQVYYRAVGTVAATGVFGFTETNAYSGNNGRAAILNSSLNAFYTAGNAGNGDNPQPAGVVAGAGAQLIPVAGVIEYRQDPGAPTPVASFSVTELGDKADKIGKDDNFRGMAIFNNVLYYSKGSGSNGVNTVYFVDTTGSACPMGVGLPAVGATLPTTAISYDPDTVATTGLANNMCILKGFPTTSNKSVDPTNFPQGIWFANATTLYIADEGDGYVGGADLYTHAAAQTTAGLEKWVFNAGTQTWTLAYTLTNGLNMGKPYVVATYPTGTNAATGLPWAPATAGLRNLTGMVGDGTTFPVGSVALFAVSSTVSGAGDPGADPNRAYWIVDTLANTTPAAAVNEKFYTLRYANYGEVLRGVSFTPGTTGITTY